MKGKRSLRLHCAKRGLNRLQMEVVSIEYRKVGVQTS